MPYEIDFTKPSSMRTVAKLLYYIMKIDTSENSIYYAFQKYSMKIHIIIMLIVIRTSRFLGILIFTSES